MNIKETKAILVETCESLMSQERSYNETSEYTDAGKLNWAVEAIGYCGLIENTDDEYIKGKFVDKLTKILNTPAYTSLNQTECRQLKFDFNQNENDQCEKRDHTKYGVDNILTMVF